MYPKIILNPLYKAYIQKSIYIETRSLVEIMEWGKEQGADIITVFSDGGLKFAYVWQKNRFIRTI